MNAARTIAIVAALGVAAPASAQPRPAGAARAATSDVETSRQHLQAGHAHFHAGRYDEAAAEYRAGYARSGLPEFVFNVAQALRLKGDRAGALIEYRKFLRLAPEHALAAEVRETIDRLERERKQDQPAEVTVHAATTVQVGDSTSAPAPGRGLRIAGIATAAAGVVAFGIAAGWALEVGDIEDQLGSADTPWPEDGEALLDRGQSAERQMVFWSVTGGAALAVGAGLYAFGWYQRESAVRITPAPAVGGAAVLVEGRF